VCACAWACVHVCMCVFYVCVRICVCLCKCVCMRAHRCTSVNDRQLESCAIVAVTQYLFCDSKPTFWFLLFAWAALLWFGGRPLRPLQQIICPGDCECYLWNPYQQALTFPSGLWTPSMPQKFRRDGPCCPFCCFFPIPQQVALILHLWKNRLQI
jgi:hypothetical protein